MARGDQPSLISVYKAIHFEHPRLDHTAGYDLTTGDSKQKSNPDERKASPRPDEATCILDCSFVGPSKLLGGIFCFCSPDTGRVMLAVIVLTSCGTTTLERHQEPGSAQRHVWPSMRGETINFVSRKYRGVSQPTVSTKCNYH